MNEFLQKLIQHDLKKSDYEEDSQIIKQGLAPISAISSRSINIQKANLLEQSKFLNWNQKAEKLFPLLDQNSINFLVFKGFAYSFLLYNNEHLRPYSDIDIIIHESDYQKTLQLLLKSGYSMLESRQGKFVSYQNSFSDNKTPQTIIDLHWQINNRIEFHQHFKFNQLYQSSIEINTQQIQFKSLNHIDAFILSCFHYQAHRPSDRKHIWLYDLALMWNKMDDKTKINCLTCAIERKQANIVNALLIILNQTFYNCLEINTATITTYEASNDYLQVRNRKITDIKIKFKNINGIRNKLKFISEYIFQSKKYVQNRYKTSSDFLVYLYYPKMWIEDMYKLFKQ